MMPSDCALCLNIVSAYIKRKVRTETLHYIYIYMLCLAKSRAAGEFYFAFVSYMCLFLVVGNYRRESLRRRSSALCVCVCELWDF